jgi:hypothetical protein
MPINWHDEGVKDRLLAAMIASVDNKVWALRITFSHRSPPNLPEFLPIQPSGSSSFTTVLLILILQINVAEIARLYGSDMTYHAVENYLRKFRREAKDMKAQAEGRMSAAPSPARPRQTKKIASPTKAGMLL